MKKKLSAFTLLEAMIILAIISILLVIGVPGLQSFRVNSNMTTTTNDLVAALHYARSESIKLGARVVICPSPTSMEVVPGCGDESNWADGWLVFQDVDNNGLYNNGETILKRFSGLSLSGVNVTTLPLYKDEPLTIRSYVSFVPPRGEPQETTTNNQSGVFRICTVDGYSANGGSKIFRGVALSPSGRIYSSSKPLELGGHVTCD